MAGQNFHITGGSDRVLFDEMELLQSQGHEVIPFCASSSKNEPSKWSEFFPAAASFDSPGLSDVAKYVFSRAAQVKLKSLLDVVRPDLAHLHIYYGKLTASILSPLSERGIPIVQTLHEYKVVCPVYTLTSNGRACNECSGFDFYNVILNRCNRGSLSRSIVSCVESYVSYLLGSVKRIDHFVAVSDYLREKVVSMGIPASKVTTVHNFVEFESLVPNYEVGSHFVYFGRIEKNKGVWTLIKAFEKLPQLKLTIVGEGGELRAIKEYCVNSKGGLKNISFLGFLNRNELRPILQSAVCIIVPSVWDETFGLTAAEALAYGKPVIASRIGGIPEVLSEGEDSLLVTPGSVDELISAVEHLSIRPALAVEMGRQGRKNVEAKFSKEKHYEKLLSVYEGVRAGR